MVGVITLLVFVVIVGFILWQVWIRTDETDIEAKRLACLKKKICFYCGYDLRGGHSVCPECGAACKAANPAGESPAAGN